MKFVRLAVAGLCLLLVNIGAYAAVVTVNGDDVSFTYDNATLYGTGTVIGNNIFFQPEDFVAESLNGAGLVQATAMLDIQVQVITAGYWLEKFQLAEQGDYKLIGEGATADASGIFAVNSNNNAYSDSNAFSAGPLTVQDALTAWSTGSIIDLGDTVGWNTDTDVDMEITNYLSATTENVGEQAFVQKKLGAVGITITAVPVPAAVWLFGSGLLGLMGFARRRAAA